MPHREPSIDENADFDEAGMGSVLLFLTKSSDRLFIYKLYWLLFPIISL